MGKSRRRKKTSPIIRIFFKQKWSFGRKGKFLVFKSWIIQSFVGFWIRRIFRHAHGHMLDLPRRPPWDVGFYLVESIIFDHIFIKLVPLVQSQHRRVIRISAEGCGSLVYMQGPSACRVSVEVGTQCMWGLVEVGSQCL